MQFISLIRLNILINIDDAIYCKLRLLKVHLADLFDENIFMYIICKFTIIIFINANLILRLIRK